MPELDITLLRMVQLWCGAILFGVPLFGLYGPHEGFLHTRRVVAAAWIGMAAASISAVGVQTVSLTSVPLSAPDVLWYLTETRIGNIFILRFIVLFAYIALLAFVSPSRLRSRLQVVLGGTLLGSFAWTGHGAGNQVHATAVFIHLIAAGVWGGALVALSSLLARAHRDDALIEPTVRGLRSFSNIGVGMVAVLIASGAVNALFAFGLPDVSLVLESTYAQTLLLKLALLVAMLALACLNRYRLSPLLEQDMRKGDSALALKYLRGSVFTETALAVLVLGLAASLASMEPPT